MTNEIKKNFKGRAAISNRDHRYQQHSHQQQPDDWYSEPSADKIPTEVTFDTSRSILTRNQSPDVPFELSINPYRGCEHGCIYCFARPTHAWLELSPGLDFETRLIAKPDAADLLTRALTKPDYRCTPIALGTNTDPYQPIERQYKITRSILQVLHDHHHPCLITTKSSMIERDIDLLANMARQNLCAVSISITTLDHTITRTLEPRATSPLRRLQTIRALHDAGIPVQVSVAPVIPVLTDNELENILKAAREHGAQAAQYILLRLPLEVTDLFSEWLAFHHPDKTEHVLSLIRQSRAGKTNDARFGSRLRGEGVFADMLAQRFKLACRKQQLENVLPSLNTQLFKTTPQQLELF